MTNLKVEVGYLRAVVVQVLEGKTCAIVECHDYDHYRTLPDIVSYEGVMMSKTGWNSDTNHAHYQSHTLMLRVGK